MKSAKGKMSEVERDMDERYTLAIDQGTSGSKALVFDSEGRIAAKATSPLRSSYPRPGYVEQDPEEIYRSVLAAVGQCLEAFARTAPVEAIAACGISNQRETFLLWDRRGRPLHPAVVWQCNRSVGICNRLKDAGLETEVQKRTGLILDPYFSGTKAVWLYENDDKVRQAVDSGEAMFGTVDTWLLYRLTCGQAYRTDYTNASRTLFFNIHDLGWDRFLLAEFGLQDLVLPDPQPSASCYGQSDFGGLLPKPIDVGAMIGDSHASAFGQCCFAPGSAKVTMGTGSSILMNTGDNPSASENGMMTTICWSVADRVDYALEGIIISCGSTLTWLRDRLGLFDDVGALEEMARAVDSSSGVYLIPAFAGLGAPHWRMGAKAEIVGLTFESTKDHVIRAALESIPFQIKDVISAMEADAGVRLKALMADGGISKNRFVMQCLADLLETPVVQRGIEEVSAFGAACLAGLQCGVYRDLGDLQDLVSSPEVYEGRNRSDSVREAYQGWVQAVKGVR